MPRSLVVGAGIAGLVAARALRARGWATTVYERSPAPEPAGAGIVLGANAVACLDTLGLGPALRAAGRRVRRLRIADAAGRALQEVEVAEVRAAAQVWTFTRADLHRVLAEGIPVEHARAVEAADERGVSIDGRRVEADLVVGADGIHSRARVAVADVPLRYSGQTCWRTLGADPLDVELTVERWGPGVRLGTVPLRGGQLYTFFVASSPPGTPGPVVDRVALAGRFAAFGDLPGRILAAAKMLLHHDLYDLPRQVWGRGRLVLIGDAAHAMTPNLGQGAAMGIEDALVLAEVAEGADPAAELAARRQPRVARVWGRSWQVGQVAHWRHPVARWARDTLVRWTPQSVTLGQLREVMEGGPVAP